MYIAMKDFLRNADTYLPIYDNGVGVRPYDETGRNIVITDIVAYVLFSVGNNSTLRPDIVLSPFVTCTLRVSIDLSKYLSSHEEYHKACAVKIGHLEAALCELG